jgi:hypothetical protein
MWATSPDVAVVHVYFQTGAIRLADTY